MLPCTRIGQAPCLLVLLASLFLGGGCVSPVFDARAAYDYFAAPAANDAWSRKIREWQSREVRSRGGVDVAEAAPRAAGVAPTGALRTEYDRFRSEQRRLVARDLAEWIQGRAPDHYVSDGPIDHWATLEGTLHRGQEDCDGLELLVYQLLRDLGFDENEVFRAIVVRRSDGQHHMVTLWFEDPSDPWVIDPTGAMTTGMPRMSEVPDWQPLKVFSVSRDFTVRDAVLTAGR